MTWIDELEGSEGYLTYLRGKGTSANYVKNATATLRHLGRRFERGSFLNLTKGDLVT